MELVREFARHNSETAFTELVRRHINLVYSVARRCTGNDGDAHDVAQAVFIILARKAAGLREKTLLTGWLYETTRFAAARLLRTNARRHAREQEAYMQSTLNETNIADVWTQLPPHLETAMGKLNTADRALLVLRFYENKSGPEAAALLGIREDTAHKRVTRAIEKLRKVFAQRGVTLTATAIVGAVSANSVQAAPMALAKSVTAVAIAKGAAASGSTLTLIKGALKIMAWTKMKTVIVVGVSVLFVAGTTMVVIKQTLEPRIDDTYFDLNSDDALMRQAPPMLVVRPTHFPQESAQAKISDFTHTGKMEMVGRAVSFEWLLQNAYGSPTNYQGWPENWPEKRMILLANLPTNKFDFLVTVPDFRTAFQARLKKQFGIIGRKETRDVDVFLLQLKTTSAVGLKQSTNKKDSLPARQEWEFGPDKYIGTNRPFPEFTDFLQGILNRPLIDQSGLEGLYDINLKWNSKETDWNQPAYDGLKQALLDQLGLELIPTNMPIEMLVFEKVK